MSGGPVIIIDPKNKDIVRSPFSIEATVAALREIAERLEQGFADIAETDDGEG